MGTLAASPTAAESSTPAALWDDLLPGLLSGRLRVDGRIDAVARESL
jgi:hypothetical protein